MRRVVPLLVLLAVALGVGVAGTTAAFESSERSISIGAHDATLQPDFSGAVVVDFGPLLPLARLPLDDPPLGVGARIRLGDSEAASLDELITRDAVIASQPNGEIATVRSALREMFWESVARGAGLALLVTVSGVVAWSAVGAERRAVLATRWRRPDRRRTVLATGLGAVLVLGLALVAVPPSSSRAGEDVEWVPASEVFATLPDDDLLNRLELARGAALNSGKSLIEGGIRTYRESDAFYDRLARTAEDVELRTPTEGQTTALVVTDRHDNVAMDPVARQLAENAEAQLLIDLGDDTSNGASWEEFSINSLADEFDGFDVVAVAGNHDQGPNIQNVMKRQGFEVLDGDPVTVGGVRFLGQSDPRASGLTKGYTGDEDDNIAAVRDQDAALTKAACDDGEVSVIAVHSASSAKKAAASGCVDLVLAGHLHRQVGPDVVEGKNGRSTVVLTTASTGGAIYAFALGTGLRREAQVTVVTFEDGRPVGLQLVDILPGGQITPQEYYPMTPSPRDGDESPAPAGTDSETD